MKTKIETTQLTRVKVKTNKHDRLYFLVGGNVYINGETIFLTEAEKVKAAMYDKEATNNVLYEANEWGKHIIGEIRFPIKENNIEEVMLVDVQFEVEVEQEVELDIEKTTKRELNDAEREAQYDDAPVGEV